MAPLIQDIPITDSPNNDAFEAIVETYYQAEGYITSSGKWFWVWADGKKQRGYQDIDVLAVNSNETVIVSVTSNLDDKVNTTRVDSGVKVNEEGLERLKGYFDRVHKYLYEVEQYRWMVSEQREIRRVVAYNRPFKTPELVRDHLKKEKIEILQAKEMLITLRDHVNDKKHQKKRLNDDGKDPKKHLKIQNQLLRTIQLLMENDLLLDEDANV